MRTLIVGLEEAFRSFGGVLPGAALRSDDGGDHARPAPAGRRAGPQSGVLRFAHHWSFTPRACGPYRAQTKDKVERPARYRRDNFVYGRTFVNDADLDQRRRHGSTTSPKCGCMGRRGSVRATDLIVTSGCCCTRSPRGRIRHSSSRRCRAAPGPTRRRAQWSLSRNDPWRCMPVSPGGSDEERTAVPPRPPASHAGGPTDARRARSPGCDPSGRRWRDADCGRGDSPRSDGAAGSGAMRAPHMRARLSTAIASSNGFGPRPRLRESWRNITKGWLTSP